jgi:hypothetical protein
MNDRVKKLMEEYSIEELAVLLDEQLTMLDNIADQFGAEFLGQFVGEENE